MQISLFLVFLASISIVRAQERNCATPPADLNTCLEEVCGPASPKNSLSITNDNFDQLIKTIPSPDEQARQLAILEGKLTAFISEHNQAIDEIKTLLNSPQHAYDFDTWSDYQRSYLEEKMFKNIVEFKFDHSKPLPERLSYEIHLKPTWAQPEEFDLALKAFVEVKRQQQLSSERMQIFSGVLTTSEIESILRRQMDQIKEPLLRLDQTKISVNQRDEIKELQDLQAQGAISDPLKQGRMSYLLNQIKGTVGLEKDPPVNSYSCINPECKRLLSLYLRAEEVPSLVSGLAPITVSSQEIKDRAITCLSASIMNEERKRQADSFRAILPELLNDFISRAMAESSEHSKKAFRDYFTNEVRVILEPDLNEKSLRARLEDLRRGSNPLWSLMMFDLKDDPLSTLPECAKPKIIRDKIVRDSEPTFHLSYFTCSNHAYGKGIAAHEMGHLLSLAISRQRLSPSTKDKFLERRECISNRHLQALPPNEKDLHHYGDHLRSEEDMADYLSALTVPTGALKSCSLLPLINDNTQYQDTLSSNSSYEHTGAVMRVIWEALQKDRLPASCRQIMEGNLHYSLRRCGP